MVYVFHKFFDFTRIVWMNFMDSSYHIEGKSDWELILQPAVWSGWMSGLNLAIFS